MEAMRDFPDDFFDLAIVDPPYGGGFTEGGGCKGWFTKYHHPEMILPGSGSKNLTGGGYNRYGGMFQKSIGSVGTTRPHGVPKKQLDGQEEIGNISAIREQEQPLRAVQKTDKRLDDAPPDCQNITDSGNASGDICTNGTQAAKKSSRGTQRRRGNISKNYSVFHAIRSYSAATISSYHLQGASSYIARRISRFEAFRWLLSNTHGRVFGEMR